VGFSLVMFDEAGFRLVPVYKRVWFFRGEKPQSVFFWSKKKLEIFGALVDGKKFYYEWYDSLNTLTYLSFLINFMEQLPKKKKYVFLLDNAGYHKTNTIRNFLARFKNVIVEFFPPYSPELNATETCWKIIRQNVTNSTYFPTLESMQAAIDTFLVKHNFILNLSNYLCR
jgi:transposase